MAHELSNASRILASMPAETPQYKLTARLLEQGINAERERAQIQGERDRMQRSLQDLQRSHDLAAQEVLKKLQEEQAERARIAKEREEALEKVSQVEKERAQIKEDKEKAIEERLALEAKVTKDSASLAAAHALNKSLQQDLDARAQELSVAKATVEDALGAQGLLKEQLQTKGQAHEDALKELSTAKSTLEDAVSSQDILKEQLLAKTQAHEKVVKEMSVAKTTLEDVIASQGLIKDQLQAKAQQHEEELAAANAALRDAASMRDQFTTESQELSTMKSTLESKVQHLNEQLQSNVKELAVARSTLEDAVSNQGLLKDQLQAKTQAHQDVLKDKEKAIEERLALEAKLAEAQSEVAKDIVFFVELGQYDQIVAYVKDYSVLLQNMVTVNPEVAANFAKKLLEGSHGGAPLIDINQVVKVFMGQNRLQETTSVLLDALKDNKPEQAELQTELLAMNLQQAPKVAENILQMKMFTHYNKQHIGQLCEKAGLVHYAVEHYQDPADLKRCMLQSHNMTPDSLSQFFGRLPTVIGTLIDQDCSDDVIKTLLQNVRSACPVEPLVAEVEKRNKLRVLVGWLEQRQAEGNQDPHLHNALAKIRIDTNHDAESFLKTNAYYDSMTVGKYCEDRYPHLAYTAYKRAWGSCDDALLNITNKNRLYILQASYLVERQSPELWATVLDSENEHRQAVIHQVVGTALPDSTNADELSTTCRAFITADLPNELTRKVWYKLAQAQLLQNSIPEAIDSYLKAEDPTDYEKVIEKAERAEAYSELIKFLLMARKTVQSQLIDGELVYSYAKTEAIADMEEFVSNTNSANPLSIADRLRGERAYAAARVLYETVARSGSFSEVGKKIASKWKARSVELELLREPKKARYHLADPHN